MVPYTAGSPALRVVSVVLSHGSWRLVATMITLQFDALFASRLSERDFAMLTNRNKLGSILTAAHPTVDHYLPALTIAGASNQRGDLTFMTNAIDLGSVSMRSFVFHAA